MSKWYKVKVYYPEIEDIWEVKLSEAEYNEYREVIDKARKEFLDEYPEDINNEEGWNQWLEDTMKDYDFKITFFNGFVNQEADVLWIDLDHPIEKEDE